MAKHLNRPAFKEWFVAERVRNLAAVILTRRSDLDFEDAKEETGLDYLVHIVHDHRRTGKMFALLLRGAMAPLTEERANKVLRPAVADFRGLGPFHYPVCLFFFTMRDDQGYCTWLLEPVITDQGAAKLIPRADPACRKLGDDALDQVVSAVNAWYDVLVGNPVS